jgi:hypothetical protein
VTGPDEDFFWGDTACATTVIELAPKIVNKNAKCAALSQDRRLLRTMCLLHGINVERQPVYLDTNERQPGLTGIWCEPEMPEASGIGKISRFNYKFGIPLANFRKFQSKATELCVCLPSSRLAV